MELDVDKLIDYLTWHERKDSLTRLFKAKGGIYTFVVRGAVKYQPATLKVYIDPQGEPITSVSLTEEQFNRVKSAVEGREESRRKRAYEELVAWVNTRK